jgi:hypothetical protein
VSDLDLAELDAAIEHALDTGDESGLEVIGYGEISSVVAYEGHACKRLPLFDSQERVDAYRACVERYLETLSARGVAPVESRIEQLPRADGRISVYCVQPILNPERLAVRYLEHIHEEDAVEVLNWVIADGDDDVHYLDVTTPMIRRADGSEVLDTDLFLSSLPWMMRGLVRRFMLADILAKYYDPRGAVIDLLGNLYKERLDRFIPAFIERANQKLEQPIDETRVRRYYASDKRTWAGLLMVRRLDRAWQRRIRRRQYPFLLPGRIER